MKKRAVKSSGWDNKVLIGFALAVHDLIRCHKRPELAHDLMTGHAIGPDDFEAAGVSEDDMRVIRRMWRAESGRRKTAAALLRDIIRHGLPRARESRV